MRDKRELAGIGCVVYAIFSNAQPQLIFSYAQLVKGMESSFHTEATALECALQQLLIFLRG